MNTFMELDSDKLFDISAGFDMDMILGGTALVLASVTVAATSSVAIPFLVGVGLCGASGLGGFIVGTGLVS